MKVVKVTKLKDVNITSYMEGTILLTDTEMALVIKGKIEPILFKKDIQKMIRAEVKKECKKNEQ